MSFDKTQAMRNAERHVSQGKILAAISEYQQVVDHDPKDVVTLNMLGDLYAKSSDKKEAVRCYTQVAEHYSNQGFSQKAIAVYKKISKIEPDSVEISGKLAELYKVKGSVSEARSHFATLAEHYKQQGRPTEALAILKQIALLDLNDTDVYLKLAEGYLGESQEDEAADAYAEAGLRLSRACKYDAAVDSYSKALAIRPNFLPALNGYVDVRTKLGQVAEAAKALEEILEKEPYNRDILSLMVDCFMAADNLQDAEKSIIRLVEQEPANHPKFLTLVPKYLEKGDTAGAARGLTLCNENLLVGGQAEESRKWIEEILAKDPEQMAALRLSVRYCSWKRDDKGLHDELAKLAEIASRKESLEDERYALSQLVMIAPQDPSYADRLRKINETHGFTDNLYDEVILRDQFEGQSAQFQEEMANGFAISTGDGLDELTTSPSANGDKTSELMLIERFGSVSGPAETADKSDALSAATGADDDSDLTSGNFGISDEIALEKELDSIRFYIESGYSELAEGALNELQAQYGVQSKIEELRAMLAAPPEPGVAKSPETRSKKKTKKAAKAPEPEIPVVEAPVEILAETASEEIGTKKFDLDEIRLEFGLEEPEAADDDDYDTHYQMAVAYQEMGLLEDSIKEFQEAISQIGPNDKTRRFFQCANLLGHCFMQKGMAKLALKWFNRALETPGLNADEKKGLWYELGGAYEVDGDAGNAARYYEQVYAEDVDFRDVGSRIKELVVNA